MRHSDSSKVRMHDVTRRRAMKQALASSCGTACDVHRFPIPALCTSTHATRTAQQTAYLAACTPYRSNRSRKNSVEDTRRARCYLRRKRQREREMRIQGEITPRAEPPHSSQSVYRLDWPKIMTWESDQIRPNKKIPNELHVWWNHREKLKNERLRKKNNRKVSGS